MLPGDVVQEAGQIAASGLKNAQKTLNPRVVLLSGKGSASPLSSIPTVPESNSAPSIEKDSEQRN